MPDDEHERKNLLHREGGEGMITIEIALTSAVINGDRGTIELPVEDVMRALESSGRIAAN